jgi:Na+-transporting methylmalonyl-CoA/oxaloacetate decarboxylase gamma subunit
MKLLGRKKKPEIEIEPLPTRRQKRQNESYRIGRTIAGEAFSDERKAKLERLKERKKTKRKNVGIVLAVLLLVVLVGIVIGHYVSDIIAENNAKKVAPEVLEPTVDIADENANTEISKRVKEFVARLEDDARVEGYPVDHAILPLNKVREIHVYIKDRNEYYKMTIDRSSAVQAEDMGRMIRYLDKKKVKATYVDLRVEGKAYYK